MASNACQHSIVIFSLDIPHPIVRCSIAFSYSELHSTIQHCIVSCICPICASESVIVARKMLFCHTKFNCEMSFCNSKWQLCNTKCNNYCAIQSSIVLSKGTLSLTMLCTCHHSVFMYALCNDISQFYFIFMHWTIQLCHSTCLYARPYCAV